MPANSDVVIHRKADGSIDTDFYIRRAIRQRSFAKKQMLATCSGFVRAALSRISPTTIQMTRPVIRVYSRILAHPRQMIDSWAAGHDRSAR